VISARTSVRGWEVESGAPETVLLSGPELVHWTSLSGLFFRPPLVILRDLGWISNQLCSSKEALGSNCRFNIYQVNLEGFAAAKEILRYTVRQKTKVLCRYRTETGCVSFYCIYGLVFLFDSCVAVCVSLNWNFFYGFFFALGCLLAEFTW
jgi:hypothetical protein